jgi:hypothetical protein
MVKSCPICGAEIKEDYKFCLSCGYNLQTAEPSIDKTAEMETPKTEPAPAPTQPVSTAPPPPPPPPPQPQQPPPQQTYQPPQTYEPTGKKSSPMKIIGILIAIIVIVVVVVIVLMMIGGAGGPLVGEWQADTFGYTYGMKLNGDHSLEMSYAGSPYVNVGEWEEKSGQICLTMLSGYTGSGGLGSMCYDYELSQDGRTMTWSLSGMTAMTFTKK